MRTHKVKFAGVTLKVDLPDDVELLWLEGRFHSHKPEFLVTLTTFSRVPLGHEFNIRLNGKKFNSQRFCQCPEQLEGMGKVWVNSFAGVRV